MLQLVTEMNSEDIGNLNIFGWPKFDGEMEPMCLPIMRHHAFTGTRWISYDNDLASIIISNNRDEVTEGFKCDYVPDMKLLAILLALAIKACKINPETVTLEQIETFHITLFKYGETSDDILNNFVYLLSRTASESRLAIAEYEQTVG